ncbi:hypothetical protein [Fervidobacterium sp.]
MELTLSGLIASMIVMIFVIAMLGLIFNLVIKVLDERQEYASFYTEIQSITSLLDSILTQSVWNDEWITANGQINPLEIDANGRYINLKFFAPSGRSVVTVKKRLEFLPATNGVIIRFDNKDLVRTSNKISDIKIILQTKDQHTNQIREPKFLQTIFYHRGGKLKYTIPLLTALSSAS